MVLYGRQRIDQRYGEMLANFGISDTIVAKLIV